MDSVWLLLSRILYLLKHILCVCVFKTLFILFQCNCFGNMAENEPDEDLQVEDTDSDTQSISSNDDDLPDLIDPSLVNVYDY